MLLGFGGQDVTGLDATIQKNTRNINGLNNDCRKQAIQKKPKPTIRDFYVYANSILELQRVMISFAVFSKR